MPAPVVKSFAAQSGRTVGEVEQKWQAAKQAADKKFDGKQDHHYWAYVSGTVQHELGLRHGKKK